MRGLSRRAEVVLTKSGYSQIHGAEIATDTAEWPTTYRKKNWNHWTAEWPTTYRKKNYEKVTKRYESYKKVINHLRRLTKNTKTNFHNFFVTHM